MRRTSVIVQKHGVSHTGNHADRPHILMYILDSATSTNLACGIDSDCINRATRVECPGDCSCGANCQNQRFVQKQYSDVSVVKTDKKGYGLRANVDLAADMLIYEYIGEVINETTFRRRLVQYDEEGIKHFYFMSLNKGEFIDATKKGNLGRFCNHSCNPNCYVDKWVVGDRLRMGIFTERYVQAGEELVFNYNVDRYGANPQPCYCGEPNCTGFIGGKTQTERATKLSAATIEALGLEDGEDWDIAVSSKKAKKKKAGDDDEEYVDSLQPKSLDEGAVTKVMATLMQCKEKWIAVKLLGRIQRCDEERVRNRVARMHGYQILKTVLTTFIEDSNVALQVLDILHNLPRITRNKIQDSKIEPTIEKLMDSDNEDVKSKASELVKIWNKLEVAYRIPRLKRDPNAEKANERAERAERDDRRKAKTRSKSRSKSPDIPKGPSGPGSRQQQPSVRPNFLPQRPIHRRPAFVAPLPAGWFSAQANGKTYFYSANGQTTWTRPSAPAVAPPPPPKEKTNEQKLQDIINSITQPASVTTPQEKTSSNGTPQQVVAAAVKEESKPDKKEKKEEKWKSYSEEKQMKVYENTVSIPIIL
jgi:SET domain-containing protein